MYPASIIVLIDFSSLNNQISEPQLNLNTQFLLLYFFSVKTTLQKIRYIFCKHQFCDIIRLFCILGFYCISTIFNESGSTSGLSCHEQRIVHYLLQNFIDVVYMTRLPISSTQIVKATFPCQYDYIKHQMIQCTYLDRQIGTYLSAFPII